MRVTRLLKQERQPDQTEIYPWKGWVVHTEIEVIVPSSRTDELIDDLQQMDDVISLSIVREASIKPPGDVLTVHVLNRGADEVTKLADAARVVVGGVPIVLAKQALVHQRAPMV